MEKPVILGLYLAVASMGASCSSYLGTGAQGSEDVRTQEPPFVSPEWGYSGEIGPEHWAELSPDYALAKLGNSQSPIDIPSDLPIQDLSPVGYNYSKSHINLIYNGHTVEEIEDRGSSLLMDGTTYELKQFHFHSPSEHTIDGEHYPMELHLVHKSTSGRVVVVAVMISQGKRSHPEYATLWKYLPSVGNRHRTDQAEFDTESLLPEDRSAYRYTGSFTTPPCTEGVKWIVLKTPVSLTSNQIALFRSVIDHNNRPLQPLNGRRVILSAR
ncbi:MAG: carbonic anhydrase family protein [Myxococcales bacterium]|nr:carbonic anhydrase family protein [Myxococcales bacterium]